MKYMRSWRVDFTTSPHSSTSLTGVCPWSSVFKMEGGKREEVRGGGGGGWRVAAGLGCSLDWGHGRPPPDRCLQTGARLGGPPLPLLHCILTGRDLKSPGCSSCERSCKGVLALHTNWPTLMTFLPLPPTATIPSSEITSSAPGGGGLLPWQLSLPKLGKLTIGMWGEKFHWWISKEEGLKGKGEGEKWFGGWCSWRWGAFLVENRPGDAPYRCTTGQINSHR